MAPAEISSLLTPDSDSDSSPESSPVIAPRPQHCPMPQPQFTTQNTNPNPTPAATASTCLPSGYGSYTAHAVGSYFPAPQPFGPALGLHQPVPPHAPRGLYTSAQPPQITQHVQAPPLSISPPLSLPQVGLSMPPPTYSSRLAQPASVPQPTTASTATLDSTTLPLTPITPSAPPTASPGPSTTQKPQKSAIPPEDQYAKDIVDRIFARYAKHVDGVKLHNRVYWHFDDATRPSAPAWPPSLLNELVMFYFNHGKGRYRKGTKVTHKSMLRFLANLRRFYAENKWTGMDSLTIKAGQRACSRVKSKCAEPIQRDGFTMSELEELSHAVWSPSYSASFRQRIDMALYIAIILGTGTQSSTLLALDMPEYDAAYAASEDKDGIRWSDFKLFMTPGGPLVSLTRGKRTFCINQGPTLGLSTGELAAIAMHLDGVIAGDVLLEYLLSPRFWGMNGSTWREVVLKQQRCDVHVFRHFKTSNPLRRSEINRELRRLSEIAGLGRVVTTGSIRRLVAEKVYQLHGFEICHAIMDHKTIPQTRRYLQKTMSRKIDNAEVEVGALLPHEQKAAWRAKSRAARLQAIQAQPTFVQPATWANSDAPSPPPTSPAPSTPTPAPKVHSNDLLSKMAAWMAGPTHYFLQDITLVHTLARVQPFERAPTTNDEYQQQTALFLEKYKAADEEEVWDEECMDSDDE